MEFMPIGSNTLGAKKRFPLKYTFKNVSTFQGIVSSRVWKLFLSATFSFPSHFCQVWSQSLRRIEREREREKTVTATEARSEFQWGCPVNTIWFHWISFGLPDIRTLNQFLRDKPDKPRCPSRSSAQSGWPHKGPKYGKTEENQSLKLSTFGRGGEGEPDFMDSYFVDIWASLERRCGHTNWIPPVLFTCVTGIWCRVDAGREQCQACAFGDDRLMCFLLLWVLTIPSRECWASVAQHEWEGSVMCMMVWCLSATHGQGSYMFPPPLPVPDFRWLLVSLRSRDCVGALLILKWPLKPQNEEMLCFHGHMVGRPFFLSLPIMGSHPGVTQKWCKSNSKMGSQVTFESVLGHLGVYQSHLWVSFGSSPLLSLFLCS